MAAGVRRGPRPAPARTGRPLSASRAGLLETLQRQPEPTGLPALAAASGLHENTVREHLEALIDAGLAHRERARPSGRGRPGWLYEATGRHQDEPQPLYGALAATLANVVARTSAQPVEDARAAGHEWGQRLAQQVGKPAGPSGVDARRKTTQLLDHMGFATEADRPATHVRLTRCPLLEAAYQQPDVVCAVHLGVAEGALAEYGYDATGTRLEPFAEPGACLLHLRTARPSGAER